MQWEYSPYSIPLLVAAFTAILLALYAWRRRTIPGATPFTGLMLSIAIWSLAYALELDAHSLASKLFWVRIEYIGIVGTPLSWLIFAIQYTGRAQKLAPRTWSLLTFMPLTTLLLVWTNELHGLIWASVRLGTSSSLMAFDVIYGFMFWIHALYSYLLIFAGTYLVIRFYFRSQGLYRQQAKTVLFATFIPWLFNPLYILDANPFPGLDFTPFAFTLTGLFFAWGFLRLQFLEIIPLAGYAIMESMKDAVMILDVQDRIVELNPSAQSLLGRKNSDVHGLPADLVFAEHPEMIRRFAGVKEACEVLPAGEGEAQQFLELRISPLCDQRANFAGRLVILQDITERQRAKLVLQEAHDELERRVHERTLELESANEKLRTSEAELRAVFAAMTDTVMVFDRAGNYMKNAPTNSSFFYEPTEGMLGKNLHQIFPVRAAESILEKIQQALASGKTVNVDFSLDVDGQKVWLAGAISPIQEHQVVLVARDITDRKASEEQLAYKALHDALTGLPNRRLFLDRLVLAFERAKRHHPASTAVLFMDLDGFKSINDNFGHANGDKFLKVIARRLKTCTRSIDTVARFGGDEFAILLEDIQGVDEALHIAARIQEELSTPIQLGGQAVYTSASIGIALANTNYLQAEDILKDADTAMYLAKARGKGRHEVFDAKMQAQNLVLVQMEADLRRAIERRELQLCYQPIVNLTSGQVICVEALLRWRHPEQGVLLPEAFLSLAEETRLIHPIGEWVFQTACAQGKAWHAAGHTQLRVAVNISARQFGEPHFLELVSRVLSETGLEPQFLELEISEAITLQKTELTIGTLHALAHMGVRISIDDFGTGYSSLTSLIDFPTGALKIDRSFIRNLVADPHRASLAATIIAMAHSLNLTVIAEGVETDEQLGFLVDQKCDHVQGFLISRPVPQEDISRLLMAQNDCYTRLFFPA